EEYQEVVNQGEIPLLRGHLLSEEDLIIRKHILNIMCHFETSWKNTDQQTPAFLEGLKLLDEMKEDGLVIVEDNKLTVPEKGRLFVRNICMCFDAKMIREKPETQVFSQTV
ncbi:MAG: coproporphyrinogen III oxidase, partial [Flavobacteriales bacterium]|nr:coproporphyrinogen III oxidase [Flavobacteriales bacterium]